jgi:hypothetical protein
MLEDARPAAAAAAAAAAEGGRGGVPALLLRDALALLNVAGGMSLWKYSLRLDEATDGASPPPPPLSEEEAWLRRMSSSS